VLKENHKPSYGFIEWMTQLGVYSGSRDPKKQDRFIFDEMGKIWAYWKKYLAFESKSRNHRLGAKTIWSILIYISWRKYY